jgi:murein DD-endopeptidase MepM/ murein hydrolase activator NlpD
MIVAKTRFNCRVLPAIAAVIGFDMSIAFGTVMALGIGLTSLLATRSEPVAQTVLTAGRSAASTYQAPVPGALRIVNGFDAPANPYAAGHRGVDLALAQDNEVLAAGAGTVSFAGSVAGRGVVVISHPDGISTEYEPLRVTARVGFEVSAGAVLGRLAGAHSGCRVSCLHWGARRLGSYFDPLSLLTPLGVVRLLPTGG